MSGATLDPNQTVVVQVDGAPQLVRFDIRDVAVVPGADPPVLLTRGVQGPPGPDSALQITASVPLSGHRLVRALGDGTAGYADATNPSHLGTVLGLTLGAADTGAPVTVRCFGRVDEPSWNWNPALPLYAGANGQLTQTLPVGAAFLQVAGEIISPTAVNLRFSDPILL